MYTQAHRQIDLSMKKVSGKWKFLRADLRLHTNLLTYLRRYIHTYCIYLYTYSITLSI